MRRPFLASALVAVALAGCNAVTLSDLKCAGDCQVTADPFRLNLQVTYDDPNQALPGSKLLASVDGRSATSTDVTGLLKPAGTTSGTIVFTVPLDFARVTDGQSLKVDVRTTGSNGDSNIVGGTFQIKL